MVQIVATDKLLREIQDAEGIVEFVDANGKRIGTLVRPPTEEDVRIAKERIASNCKRYTTEEVVSYLRSLEKE